MTKAEEIEVLMSLIPVDQRLLWDCCKKVSGRWWEQGMTLTVEMYIREIIERRLRELHADKLRAVAAWRDDGGAS